MLDELLKTILTEKNKSLLNTTVEVLVEEKEKHNRWRGRTPQAKLVFFEDEQDLRGQLVEVNIDWTGPYSFLGRRVK